MTLATGWPNVSWGVADVADKSWRKNSLHSGVVAGTPKTSFAEIGPPSEFSPEFNCFSRTSSICTRGESLPESLPAFAPPNALRFMKRTP